MRRLPAGSGQESVWDNPRPPRVEASDRRVTVRFCNAVIAESRRAHRVLETSHPPIYDIPRDDVAPGVLLPSDRTSFCEFKGLASYWTVVVDGQRELDAAWSYPRPAPGFEALTDAVAFYPARMQECLVGEERVRRQAGGFYGGWITDDVVGPFKGEPGTSTW